MAKTLEQLSSTELTSREKEILLSINESTPEFGPAGLQLREQELIDSLRDDGVDVPIAETPLPPINEAVRFDKIMSLGNQLPESTNNEIIDNAEQLDLDATVFENKSGKIGFVEVFKRKNFFEALPFVGSVYKSANIINLMNSVKILNDGDEDFVETSGAFGTTFGITRKRTEDEKANAVKTIESFLIKLNEEQERGFSIGGRIAQGITELPAFVVEFLLTGPIFKTGSIAAKTAATKLLGRFAEKGVGKLAVKVAGAGFGSLLRTGVNVPRVIEGALSNMTQGITVTDDGAIVFSDTDKPFASLARSFADLYIENLTEISGGAIGKGFSFVGKGIGKKFPILGKVAKEIGEKWVANKAGRTIDQFLKASATKVGFDGILLEIGEERLGDILRTATGLQSVEEMIPTMEDLLVEAGVFAVPGGIILAQNQIFRKTNIQTPIVTDLGKLTEEEFAGVIAEPFVPEVVEQKIVDNTTKMQTEGIQANAREASVEKTGTFDAIRRNISRAEDAVGHWGNAGKRVQRDFREISARSAINSGTTTQNVKAILKGLNAQEKVVVAQLTDGAINSSGQPSRLVMRATELKEQLDIMQNEAMSVDLRKGSLTGRAFPQVPNKKGKAFLEEAEVQGAKSHRVFAWAQIKVQDGKFKSIDSAIAALQNYRKERLRGTEGYFEGTRKVELDLDMREWSPGKILPGIIEGGWENIEGARQWGITKDGNFKRIRSSIEQIRGEVGVDQANILEDYIKAQYGQSRASITAKKWSRGARAVQFIGKLAFSPLTITRNILDRYAKGLTHGTIGTNIRASIKFPPVVNMFMETSRKIQDEMIRKGAVLGHGHLSEGLDFGGGIMGIASKPFALSEKGNQTYIALVKQMQLEADIKRLNEMGGKDGTVSKMFDGVLAVVGKSQQQTRSRVLTNLTNDQLADALSQGEIDSDTMAEVLHRTVTDSAFPLTLASKRMWWGNRPWVQTMTQFKIWSADQMRFIYKDVLGYTVATGDPSRLFRFILGTWIAGELYNIARDFLTGKDESLASTLKDEDGRNFKDIARSVANALVDGGIVGMLADLTYGISDWALGPTVASIESLAARGFSAAIDPATTIDGLKMFVLDDVPAAKQAQGVLDRIDRTFFEENNLTENYAKWRKRSFDFRKKKGDLTAAETTIGKAIFSRTKRIPTPRSLSLELISRQVLVGDVEDAADYIIGIFKDTKPEKLKDLRQSFKQSAITNSPMGNIKRDDIPEFLNQFSTENQEQIKSLQRQWQKNYSEAIKIALTQLKDEGFLEGLREELSE